MLVLIGTGWVRNLRHRMPQWRNGLALASLVIISWQWGYLAVVLGTAYVGFASAGHATWIDWDPTYDLFLKKTDLVATVLALALKRAPRIQMIGVSVLMFLTGPSGYA